MPIPQTGKAGQSNGGQASGPTGPLGSNGVSTGAGAYNPAMQHRFVARVEGTPTEFKDHTCAIAMNFVKKELMMLVEQSLTASTREHIVIQDWIDNPKRIITLEIEDGNGQVVDTIKFRDCVVEDHAIDFNYGNPATSAVHILAISYQKIDLGAGKAQAAFASAMSIVGKP